MYFRQAATGSKYSSKLEQHNNRLNDSWKKSMVTVELMWVTIAAPSTKTCELPKY
jgi:hypothetical protein